MYLKKKRVYRRRRMMRKPLSLSQVRAVSSLVNKQRELKKFYTNIINTNCSPGNNVNFEFQPKLESGEPARLYANHIVRGDLNYNMEGSKIAPVYFKCKLLCKYLSPSVRAGFDEAVVKIVFYHRNSRFTTDINTNAAIQLENGDHTAVPNTISAIWNDFNYKEVIPFHTKTFKLQPAQINQAGEGGVMTAGNPTTPQSKMYTIVHKYSPNQQQIFKTGDQTGDNFNKYNIGAFMIVRLTNNQTTVSTNQVRVNAQCEFGFRDC